MLPIAISQPLTLENEMYFMNKVNQTTAHRSVILVRFMVWFVFLSEGLQKFLFPDVRGTGRFEKIGLPEPHQCGFIRIDTQL